MTLDRRSRRTVALLLGLGCWVLGFAGAPSSDAMSQNAGRKYGPTTPSGYYVRVQPAAISMSHAQQPQLTARVEDAAGQPVEDVVVSFRPSEGSITTGTSRTRGGTVTGTFMAMSGGDRPHTAFVIVTVEDVDVTVFIDIVPTIFGR